MKAKEEVLHLAVNYPIDPGTVEFANNFVGQADAEGMVYLSFFQRTPPLFVGDQDSVKKQLQELKSIDARCVSRIAIHRDFLSRMIEVLQTISGEIDGDSSTEKDEHD